MRGSIQQDTKPGLLPAINYFNLK